MSALNVRIVRPRPTGAQTLTNFVIAAVSALVAGWFVMLLAPLSALDLHPSYGQAVATVAAIRCLLIGIPSYWHWTTEEPKP